MRVRNTGASKGVDIGMGNHTVNCTGKDNDNGKGKGKDTDKGVWIVV